MDHGAHCNTLQHTATHCNILQHTATHCNTLQHTATHCHTQPYSATLCYTLQHSATYCNVLQHALPDFSVYFAGCYGLPLTHGSQPVLTIALQQNATRVTWLLSIFCRLLRPVLITALQHTATHYNTRYLTFEYISQAVKGCCWLMDHGLCWSSRVGP